MKLVHSKSILDCSDLELEIHYAETERQDSLIASLPDYDCDVMVVYEDSYHKEKIPPKLFESNLKNYQEFIQNEDLKNGGDAFLTDENHLAFRTYGQLYKYKGQYEMVQCLITIKCYGEGMSPIDMSKVFTPPTQALEKELSV